jgi:hypothetical protein
MAVGTAPSRVGGRCRRDAKPAIKFERDTDRPPGSPEGDPEAERDTFVDPIDERSSASDRWITLTEDDVRVSSHNGNIVVTWAPPGHGNFYVAREYGTSREFAIEAFLAYLND